MAKNIKKNGIAYPREGTKSSGMWKIADDMLSAATQDNPVYRRDIIERIVQTGENAVSAANQYANWRKFHGLKGTKGLYPKPKEQKKRMSASPLTSQQALRYYRDMLLIRRFEEKAGQLYGMGLIGGFCHLYIGQEAVVTGLQAVLQPQDQVITAYRDHGHMLACGMDPKRVMAELTGREAGYSRGKGGSMHMFSREKNFFGGHGIVGAQTPLGTGLAFANHYHDNNAVCLTYLGDGAVNQGQVYESFNMAKLWNLPVVYIIENNGYAMGTSVQRSSSEVHLYKRGLSFGIKGEAVDGMDILAVRQAGDKAVKRTREGGGPFILEMKTYRYRGHSMSDPAQYRSKEEVQNMREHHDPISLLKTNIISQSWATEDDLKALDKAVRAEVNEAAQFAQTTPEPEPHSLYEDVLL